MKLRWHVVITTYDIWDSRYDAYNEHIIKSVPQLQYYDKDIDEWITVPTVEEDFK